MVRVHVHDSASVTIGALTVSAPATVDCDSFTHGLDTWGRGVVLVTSSGAELVAEQHPHELGQSPYLLPGFVVVLFALGLLWSRASIGR